jgi:hypothetical protein
LRTYACTRTRPLSKTEDIKILGEGKEPVEKKDEPNNSMDVRAKQRLSYQLVFLTRSCVNSVSPHVNSAVGRLRLYIEKP